jgi:hypothetical protein
MKYLSIQTFQCGISVSGAATFTGGATINVLALNGATTSSEASLFLGAHGANEGGQLVLQKGTGQTYAAHLDNYNDQFRILYGTNTGSTGIALAVSLSNRQLILPAYTSSSSFSGTAAGYLAFDSSGNIITTAVPTSGVSSIIAGTGVTVSSGTGNVTVSIGQSVATSATPSFDQIFLTNNGNGTNVKIGDDAWIGDVNAANTLRIMGQQNNADGYIVFGNSDFTALGRSGTGNLTYGGSTVWTAATLTNLNQLTNGPGYITSAALAGYVPTSRTLTINGTSYDLSADRTWTINTVAYTSRLQHQVKAGVAINKGQAVYVTSADGTNMIVGLASNASEATSSKTMGLLDATVSTNGFANVVTEGLLDGLDTSTAGAAGDPVWLGTGGNLIYGLGSKPYAPAHLVFIGIVTRKNANNGEIFVKVQNGFELNEIHDVDLKTNLPTAGQLLRYDSDGLWKNWSPNYLTAEADTLATVTTRGNTTTNAITVGGLIVDTNTLVVDSVNDRVVIGATTATNKLEIFGTGTSGGVSSNVGYNIQPVAAPVITGVTYALQAGTALEIGTYYYRVTYYNAIGETNASAEITIITTAGNRIVQLNNIPTSTDASVIGRKIYRTKVTDSSSYGVVIATLANNTTTTYTDSTPDTDPIFSGSVLTRPIYSKANTTARYIAVSGVRSMILDPSLTTFGVNAGAAITVAPNVTLFGANAGQNITYGGGNTLFGSNAGNTITGGFQNVAIGDFALYQVTTGSYNIGIGPFTNNRNNSHTIALGYYTGNATTGDNNILIGSYIGSSTLAMTNSVIIGHNATPLADTNNQINIANTIYGRSNTGNVQIGTTTDAGYKLDVNGTARIKGNVDITTSGNTNVLLAYSSYVQAWQTFYVSQSGGTHNFVVSNASSGGNAYFNNVNVGIGTTSPAKILDIAIPNAAHANYGIRLNSVSGYGGASLYHDYGQGNGSTVFKIANDYGDARINLVQDGYNSSGSPSSIRFFTAPFGGGDVGVERVRFASDGNVGIGTTNPTYKLDVNGSIRTSGVGGLNIDASANFGDNSGANFDILNLGSTRALRILGTSNGGWGNILLNPYGANVGIGTTSPVSSLSVVGKTNLGGQASGFYVTPSTLHIASSTVSQISFEDYIVTAAIALANNTFAFGHQNASPSYEFKHSNTYNGNYATTGTTFARFNPTTSYISSGNIGIGTTSPTGKLDIVPSAQNAINISRAGGYASFYSSNDLVFETDSVFYFGVYTPRLFSVNGSFYTTVAGSVGIGTSSPSQKLHVVGASILANNSSINPDTYVNTVIAGAIGTVGGWGLSSAIGGNAGTGHSWAIGTNGDNLYMGYSNGSSSNSMLTFLQVDDSTRNVFLVPQSGNVGIGNASPSYKLDVSGALRATGTVYSDNGSLAGALNLGQVVSIGSSFGSYANLIFTMHNGGGFSDIMKLQGNGNVGIGTNSPSGRVHIKSSGLNTYPLLIQRAANTNNIFYVVETSGGDGQVVIENSGGGAAVQLHSNGTSYFNGGNVGIGTTTPSTLLDVSGVITATGGNSTNWNTAYGWGNHSSAGYVPQARTLTINGTSYDLSANRSWTISAATPGGSDTQFQYNSSGSLAGASALTYNSTTNRVGINQASPGYDLDVNGQVRVQDKLRVGTGNGVVHMSSTATINPSATTVVWAQTVSVGMCAFIEYYILNNNSLTDQRAGTIMVTWNQSGTPTIAHTETTTPDIGSTTTVNFTSSLVGSDARINAVNSSANPYTIVMSYKYF